MKVKLFKRNNSDRLGDSKKHKSPHSRQRVKQGDFFYTKTPDISNEEEINGVMDARR